MPRTRRSATRRAEVLQYRGGSGPRRIAARRLVEAGAASAAASPELRIVLARMNASESMTSTDAGDIDRCRRAARL